MPTVVDLDLLADMGRMRFAHPGIVHAGYANRGGSAHIGRIGFGVEF
jgi:hypothetical protein